MANTLSIARQQLRLLFTDPGPIIQYVFVPLLIMALLRTADKTLLVQQGFTEANGSEQVVPGFTAMFSFFWVRQIGELFFMEHGWGTWDRLQTSSARPAQIIIGKLLPFFFVIALQHATLFGLGTIIFDLNANGAVGGLAIVFTCLNLCVLSLALMLVALCRTVEQLDAVGTALADLFGAVGGALVPSFILPKLVEDIAPATPVYWAVDTSRAVILEGEGLSAVWGPSAVLLGFATVFALVAASRFRFAEPKFVEAG